MKDEVLEMLAPELLPRYRRWRPILTGIFTVALGLSLTGHIILIVAGADCDFINVTAILLYTGLGLGIVQMLLNRWLTRSLSGMGSQFSTRFRHVLLACWIMTSVSGLSLHDAIYNPLDAQKIGAYVCSPY